MTGFVDPSFGTNIHRGGEVKYLNQGFGQDGEANDNGHPTVLPSVSTWEFKVTYFHNLSLKGVKVARVEGHDPQAEQVIINAGKEAVAAEILETLDAAQLYGIKAIVTLGGMSDPNTAPQAYGLYDPTSLDYHRFVELAAFVADKISGHPALIVLELLNEPDYMTAIKGYWLPRYPSGRMDLLNAFAVWQDGMISAVKSKQLRPGTPIGMGTAMDSSLYCDPAGVPSMPWGTEECVGVILPRMAAGCDVWTPHLYQHERTAIALQVLRSDKLPSFIKAAQRAGKALILGEAGGLYAGGIRTAELQAVFDAYPDLVVCWMIRSWDPKVYTIPSIPARVPYSPAPVETPVETPAPVADPVPEPSDPSSPAQEPPEEPAEDVPPEAAIEPADQEPAVDPPVVIEPPIEPASPPDASGTEGGAHEGASNPIEAVPQDPAEPSPETGRGLIFARILMELARIIGRWLHNK